MHRFVKRIIRFVVILFVGANVLAAYQAYHFMHFSATAKIRSPRGESLDIFQKLKVLVKGIDNPRPENDSTPALPYSEININSSNGRLSCWYIPKKQAKGTVVLFHGFGASKAKMLHQAASFHSLGYRTFLVDFTGSGGSAGNRTTIGYYEAADVLAAYQYVSKTDSNIILFGVSMGASAIIRAISVYQLHPSKIVLECPYGSITDAVKNRFVLMGVPSFPMAYLLVFWGGAENGYWAFNQDCVSYARDIYCPTLLMRGMDDPYVSQEETDAVFKNLKGHKELHLFSNTGHESYCNKDHNEWVNVLTKFLGDK